MGKYIQIQIKRLLRVMPAVLIVVAILFGGMIAVYTALMEQSKNSEENIKSTLGLVGEADNSYLSLGLAAVKTLDASSMSMDIQQMSEEDAKAALKRGDIPAYAVLPEGFMDAAFRGQILPIRFVVSDGATGLASIFKVEITKVVGQVLVETQQGIYGARDAMWDNGVTEKVGERVNNLSVKYVDFVIDRSRIYQAEELGVGDSLGLDGYIFCGFSVLFVLLSCLAFAPVMVRRDLSLGRMLAAKGRPVVLQCLCDFGIYLLALIAVLALILGLMLSSGFMENSIFQLRPEDASAAESILQLLPVILMIGTLSFMLFEVSGNLISAVMLQFCTTLVLTFLSGCMYPVYFFPVSVQKLAVYLPTGIARTHLSLCLLGVAPEGTLWALLGFSCVFLLGACLIRHHRVTGVRG